MPRNPVRQGGCGAEARTGGIQIVDDVDAFPRHIACSSATRPEPVLPLRDKSGAPIDVIDIEKDHPAAFTRADVEALGAILEATFAAGP